MKQLNITEEALDSLIAGARTQEDLWGENGLLSRLNKAILERMLNAELDYHLDDRNNTETGRASGNSRNGKTKKTVKGSFGELEIETPRDRQSTFEPQIVPKRSRRLGPLNDAIMALYAKGMTTRDIQETIRELYKVDVSAALISEVTEAVREEVVEWQNRVLDPLYPIVWLDALAVKVHQDHQVVSKNIYVALGLNVQGQKELLGLWIAETEGAKFWSQVLSELNNRGVKDVFIFCVDGLKGFPEAIKGVFPCSDIQLCLVHRMRNSLNRVSWKDRKEVAQDLKAIYRSATLEEAERKLGEFAKKWDERYASISAAWYRNWENLISIFGYPREIREAIYTTNTIESLNMVIRKGIKNRRIFPTDEAALKLVWLSIVNASRKWTMPIKNWKTALNYFYVKFADRMTAVA